MASLPPPLLHFAGGDGRSLARPLLSRAARLPAAGAGWAVLDTVAVPLPPVGDGVFETVWETVTIADGVTEVRVWLTGPLTGTGGFDNVWMWEE